MVELKKQQSRSRSHHSTSDWDFLHVSDWSETTNWELWDATYISAPFSLRLRWQPPAKYALSRLKEAQNLKEGRVTLWVYSSQEHLAAKLWHIGVTGVGDDGVLIGLSSPVRVWRKYRATWFQGYNTRCQRCTWILSEIWDGNNWIPSAPNPKDPLSGSINRCGVGVTSQSFGTGGVFDNVLLESLFWDAYTIPSKRPGKGFA